MDDRHRLGGGVSRQPVGHRRSRIGTASSALRSRPFSDISIDAVFNFLMPKTKASV